MRKIVLNTAKPIARDKSRPGIPVFTDAGTKLAVPSRGLTAGMADAWIANGSASPVGETK